MGNLTKQDLFDHLEKHKNAVVIIGPGVLKNKPAYNQEEYETYFNNKTLRRKPAEFWKFYREKFLQNIEKNEAHKAIQELGRRGYIRRIYSQNVQPTLSEMAVRNVEYLHGRDDMYKCTNCKTLYSDEFANMYETPECEVCGRSLRPHVLFDRENYDNDLYHQLKEDLVETNTLMLVGFDFLEDEIAGLVFQFIENKNLKNRLGDPEQQTMIVCVGGDGERDLEHEALFEFLVHGDVNESMKRLME